MGFLKTISKDYFLLWFIFLGLFIRLALAFYPGFKIDIDAWFAWAIRLSEVGLSKFYSEQLWTNYTPGYLYILFIQGLIKNLFQLNDGQFFFFLKLPAIIAEIILGLIIYFEVLTRSTKKYAYAASGLILLNPALIFNSAIWGQIDGFLSLFMILAIIFLKHNKLFLSSVFFGCALLIKPQALAIAPIYFLFTLKNFSIKNLLKITLPGLIMVFLFSLPFFISSPLTGLFTLLSKMTSDYKATSLFAYNFWGVVGFWIDDSQKWFNLAYQHWGLLLTALYWLILSFFYFKKSIGLYSLASLATLAFYFLPTRVHERYLYPAIPFIALSFGLLKNKKIFALGAILSLTYFLNLYYVYVYYNEFYLNLPKLLYLPPLYDFLDKNGKALSVLSSLVFVSITLLIYIHDYNKKTS
jgi:dolichyl-phosphate-mannose-protein mannosyltransferase